MRLVCFLEHCALQCWVLPCVRLLQSVLRRSILRAADISNVWGSAVLQMDSSLNLDSEASLFFLCSAGTRAQGLVCVG